MKGYPSTTIRSDEENKNEPLQFINVLPASANHNVLPVLSKTVYRIKENLIVDAGCTKKLLVFKANHDAKKGDVIRFLDADFNEFEVTVKRRINPTTLEIYDVLETPPAENDLVDISRPITERSTETGATLATVSSGPLAFRLDGADQEITEDTVDPSNNVPLPVKLMGVNGTLNLTANDLNVQLSAYDATPDSVRVSNGVDDLGITGDNEALTFDENTHDKLDDLNTATGLITSAAELDPTQDANVISLLKGHLSRQNTFKEILDKGAAYTDTVLEDYHDFLENIETYSENIDDTLGSKTDAAETDPDNPDTLMAYIKGLLSNSGLGLTFLNSLNIKDFATQATLESFRASFVGTDFATQTTLSSVNNKLPPSLGEKIEASSLAVTLSTENEAILTGISGKLPASLGAKVSNSSLSVTLASNHPNIAVEDEPGNSGDFDHELINDDTAKSISAPSNAIGFVLSCDGETGPIRYRIGGTAAQAQNGGILLFPGGSTPFIPVRATISVINAENGEAGAVNVQWIRRS